MCAQRLVITGASSGIGAGLAVAFAKEGADMALYGRHQQRLLEVVDRVIAGGGQAKPLTEDVTDALAMRQSLLAFDDQRPVDCVIANAGISLSKGRWQTKAQQQVTDVNIQGVLNTILPLIDRMRARRRGHLVFISSMAAYLPLRQAPAYAASKAWLRQYGLALAPILAKEGISVTVVCPGFVKTALIAGNPFPMPGLMSVDQAVQRIVKGIHAKRRLVAFPRWIHGLTVLTSMLPSTWVARWL